MTSEAALNLDFTSVGEPEEKERDQFDAPTEIKKTIVVLPFEGREEKAESSDTTEDKPSKLSFIPKIREDIYRDTSQKKQPSNDFIMIMRSHFVNQILKSLHLIQPYAGTSSGAAYVADILRNIKIMEEKSPRDPFLEILYSLYDSLAFEGKWANYNCEHFKKAHDIIKKYVKRTLIKQRDLEKAITELEDGGFDTTPIPLIGEEDL